MIRDGEVKRKEEGSRSRNQKVGRCLYFQGSRHKWSVRVVC